MYCISCGSMIEDGTRFCPSCGADQLAAPAANAVSPVNAGQGIRTRSKKPIVGMAVIAFILSILAFFIRQITSFLMMNDYGMEIDLLSYIGRNILNIALFALLPVILAALFMIFCGFIDRGARALTGVPMIITTLLLPVSILLGKYGGFYLFLDIILFVFSVLFLIFYMIAVTGKFRSGSTGKILTTIFGCLLGLIYLADIGGYAGRFFILSTFGNLLGFAARVLTVAAMIMIVYYTAKPDVRAAAPAGNVYNSVTKFCPACGARFTEDKKFCDHCGSELSRMAQPAPGYAYQAASTASAQDAPSGGFAALGFFFPLIGLILYIAWKDQTPLRAKSCGKGALAGFITSTVLSVLLVIVYFVWLGALMSSMF